MYHLKIIVKTLTAHILQAQGAEFGDCFCGGVTALVTSLDTVAPLLCGLGSGSGSRTGRLLQGEGQPTFASLMGNEAKPMIIDTDMVITNVQENA